MLWMWLFHKSQKLYPKPCPKGPRCLNSWVQSEQLERMCGWDGPPETYRTGKGLHRRMDGSLRRANAPLRAFKLIGEKRAFKETSGWQGKAWSWWGFQSWTLAQHFLRAWCYLRVPTTVRWFHSKVRFSGWWPGFGLALLSVRDLCAFCLIDLHHSGWLLGLQAWCTVSACRNKEDVRKYLWEKALSRSGIYH